MCNLIQDKYNKALESARLIKDPEARAFEFQNILASMNYISLTPKVKARVLYKLKVEAGLL